MKVKITDECTACGICVDSAPEVFEMGATVAQVKSETVPAALEASAKEAADGCPVGAIVIE